jgi:hypothetical protein
VEVLLAVAAGGALHDMDSLEVEVAAVGIGGVVGQADPLQELQIAEAPANLPALQAAGSILALAHGLPTLPGRISDFGF